MECSKRHAYLTQFYRTVVDNLLPAKRRKGEEEGREMVLVLDWQWDSKDTLHCLSPGQESSLSHTLHETVPHKIVETYICAKVGHSACRTYILMSFVVKQFCCT